MSRLSKYLDQDIHVPLPLRGPSADGEESPWLSDEAYQTYSVRGGTAPWQEHLHREMLIFKFKELYASSDFVKTVFQKRERQLTKDERAKQHKKERIKKRTTRQERGRERDEERRSRKRNRSDDEGGYSDDYSEEEASLSSASTLLRAGSTVAGPTVVDPVARQRNSSLTAEQHAQFSVLAKREQRSLQGVDEARPLSAEERTTLRKLEKAVKAEQTRYEETLRRWVENSRSPYRLVDSTLRAAVDSVLAETKARRKSELPQHFHMRYRTELPDVRRADVAPVEAQYVLDEKSATPCPLTVPALPVSLSSDLKLVHEGGSRLMASEDLPTDMDVAAHLSALTTVVDPFRPWAVPFTVKPSEGPRQKMVIMHEPLPAQVMTMRERARLYYTQAVMRALSGDASAAGVSTDAVMLESWKVGSFKVVVGTDRVALSGDVFQPEAMLDVDVDYAMEWSEEELPMSPQAVVRDALLAWAAVSAANFVAKVDAKNSKLVKIDPVDLSTRMHDSQTLGDLLVTLHHVIGAMIAQSEGLYVAVYDPAKRELKLYHHVEGLAPKHDTLDVHAYIDECGMADAKAMSSYVPWKWPSTSGEHIPKTFLPRT